MLCVCQVLLQVPRRTRQRKKMGIPRVLYRLNLGNWNPEEGREPYDWEKNVLFGGNQQVQGPEVGMYLVCSRSAYVAVTEWARGRVVSWDHRGNGGMLRVGRAWTSSSSFLGNPGIILYEIRLYPGFSFKISEFCPLVINRPMLSPDQKRGWELRKCW